MKDVLRTPETLAAYRKKRIAAGGTLSKVDLTTLPFITRWKYWILVENEFPYDLLASRHSLLVPRRFFAKDSDMTKTERKELFLIKEQFSQSQEYDWIVETNSGSVPGHFHLHCLKLHYVTPISELS